MSRKLEIELSCNQHFAVITSFFNPCGYENRVACWRRFAAGLASQGVSVWTIEAALVGAEYCLPDGERMLRIRMPSDGWLWQKERLLNHLVCQLPAEVTKVAWVDGDILFDDPNWITNASAALDTQDVIQLFDHVFWLGPDEEPIPWKTTGSKRPGFAMLVNEVPRLATEFEILSPGFAWAAKRDFFQQVGLYEHDVTGGNDTFMALGFMGWVDHPFWQQVAPGLRADAMQYGERAYEYVQGNLGYLPASISHIWHGAYSDRGYMKKQKRLAELGFDPQRHLATNPETGLLCWSAEAPAELKDYLIDYFHSRREDSDTAPTSAEG